MCPGERKVQFQNALIGGCEYKDVKNSSRTSAVKAGKVQGPAS